MKPVNQSPNRTTIDVAVALPVYRTFSYAVPQELVPLAKVGKRVLVPFGNRRVTGYILEEDRPAGVDAPKNILDVLDDRPLFPAAMSRFFKWVADYYMYPLGLVIKSALPGGLNITEQNILTLTQEGRLASENNFITPLENKVLHLLANGDASLKSLEKRLATPIPNALIIRLLNEGWLQKIQMLRKDRIRPKAEKIVTLSPSRIPDKPISAARQKIIDLLQQENSLPIRWIRETVPHATRLVKAMADGGYVRIDSKPVFRDPLGEPVAYREPPVLTREQENIVSRVNKRLGKDFETFLLVGVTGSGKTEVYLQLAAEAVRRRLSVLVLVPEIALITQMERRFRSRFGERVAVLHSGLSSGERYDQWRMIAQGNVQIAIGARSAVFSPFQDLGLVIVDEEHDTSYKQESSLRYHARDLAVVRAKLANAVVILGSATPSIQSYHNAMTRKFTRVHLTKRVQQRSLPQIEIVDLCRMRDHRGHRRYISDELYSSLKGTLDRGEQAILFLNRRGFANMPVCAACGESISCKNCDISLTYHKSSNAYRCHYCNFSMSAGSHCPACGSPKILHLGLGTEKLEAITAGLFPGSRIQRMDRDTIRHKGSILKILKNLKNQTIDILIGTQMVAKGHDFPNITLVGIVCADLSLNFPDFRASEQTFQMLAQVAGRAGRGDRPGKVILQTYNPDHFSIRCAKNQDIQSFYDQELVFRKSLAYPPFSRMIQVVVSSKDQAAGLRQTAELETQCRTILNSDRSFKNHVQVMGPVEAPFSKIASHYRWQMLLKGGDAKLLHGFARRLLFTNPAVLNRQGVKTAIDVDPFFMM